MENIIENNGIIEEEKKLERFQIFKRKDFTLSKLNKEIWHKAIKYIFKKDKIIEKKIKKKNLYLIDDGTCVVKKI